MHHNPCVTFTAERHVDPLKSASLVRGFAPGQTHTLRIKGAWFRETPLRGFRSNVSLPSCLILHFFPFFHLVGVSLVPMSLWMTGAGFRKWRKPERRTRALPRTALPHSEGWVGYDWFRFLGWVFIEHSVIYVSDRPRGSCPGVLCTETNKILGLSFVLEPSFVVVTQVFPLLCTCTVSAISFQESADICETLTHTW